MLPSLRWPSSQDFAADRRSALEEQRPGQTRKEDSISARERLELVAPRDEVCNSAEWLAARSIGEPDQDAAFLSVFGYAAIDSGNWDSSSRQARPQLKIFVTEHASIGKHTWYLISATYEQDGFERFQWEAARRHVHFRKLWYEHVKRELGKDYNKHFAGSHFPSSGGASSIMKKLVNWCISLARCINIGYASPAIVALTLRFLDAPGPLILDKRREYEARQDGNSDIDIPEEESARRPWRTDEQWKDAIAAVKAVKKPRRRQKQAIDIDLFAEQSILKNEATTDTGAIPVVIDPFADVCLEVAGEENKATMPNRVSSLESETSKLSQLIGKRIEEFDEPDDPATTGTSSLAEQESSTRTSEEADAHNDSIAQDRAEDPSQQLLDPDYCVASA